MDKQKELDGTLTSAIPGIQHLRERIAELEAENVSLRKLCGEMLDHIEVDCPSGEPCDCTAGRLIAKAKEVLNG